MTVIPESVTIPSELLLEAIGYVDAVAVIAAQLNDGIETDVTEQATELVVRLAAHLYEPPEGDREYEEHPVNVSIGDRSRTLVDAVLADRDCSSVELAAVRQDVAALGAIVSETRSETRQLIDQMLEEQGLDAASVARRSFQLIPGGAV